MSVNLLNLCCYISNRNLLSKNTTILKIRNCYRMRCWQCTVSCSKVVRLQKKQILLWEYHVQHLISYNNSSFTCLFHLSYPAVSYQISILPLLYKDDSEESCWGNKQFLLVWSIILLFALILLRESSIKRFPPLVVFQSVCVCLIVCSTNVYNQTARLCAWFWASSRGPQQRQTTLTRGGYAKYKWSHCVLAVEPNNLY